MGSISKHQARVKDRISPLPDALVCHILSFLPTTYSVRTTVLSKRWNNMWTCVTTLDFNDRRDFCTSSQLFANFVDRVLLFRGAADIHRFRLAVDRPHDLSRVDAWICTAVRRNVVELDLLLCQNRSKRGDAFPIPQSLFMCKTLRVLKMGSRKASYSHYPYTSGWFPSLKLLHGSAGNPNKSSMQKLCCYCPALVDLTIEETFMHEDSFNLYAPELKTLSINLHSLFYSFKFCINAPKLENLNLKGDRAAGYSFEAPSSLVNVTIELTPALENDVRLSPYCAKSLWAGISNVKCLSLSAHSLKARYLPVFGNLTKIELKLADCNDRGLLAELLNKAPILEELSFEYTTRCPGVNEEDSELQWDQLESVPVCVSSHLNSVSIRGFVGLDEEMEAAKYLLKNGYRLNKMKIYTNMGFSSEKEELYMEFLMFHRAMTCQVEFIQVE